MDFDDGEQDLDKSSHSWGLIERFNSMLDIFSLATINNYIIRRRGLFDNAHTSQTRDKPRRIFVGLYGQKYRTVTKI